MRSLNYKQYTVVNVQFIYSQHMIVIMYIRDNNQYGYLRHFSFPLKLCE